MRENLSKRIMSFVVTLTLVAANLNSFVLSAKTIQINGLEPKGISSKISYCNEECNSDLHGDECCANENEDACLDEECDSHLHTGKCDENNAVCLEERCNCNLHDDACYVNENESVSSGEGCNCNLHGDACYVNENGLVTLGAGENCSLPDEFNEKSLTGKGVKIAVLDSGITDFETQKQVSFTNDEQIVNNHGNKMAGVLKENVPNAEIYDVCVLDENGRGKYSDVSKGIQWSVENDADIIVMSFAGYEASETLESSLAYAEENDVLVIAAAGNNSSDKSTFPAAYPTVISAGSIDESGEISSFSNFGEIVDIYVKSHEGTSFSAQLIASVAAKYMQESPDKNCAEIRKLIISNKVKSLDCKSVTDESFVYAAACAHSFNGSYTTVPATCTAGAKKVGKCTKCGFILSTTTISDPLGHSYGSWTTRQTATCTINGVRTRSCTRCGAGDSQTISATKHAFNGSMEPGKPATCTEEGTSVGKCIKCGEVLTTVATPALGHSYGEWTTRVAGTCTTDGVKTRSCTRCNVGDSQTILATGHTFNGSFEPGIAATCTEEGTSVGKCINCGSVVTTVAVPATGHSYENWITRVSATCTANGVKTVSCSKCGHNTSEIIKNSGGHEFNGSFETGKPATCTTEGTKVGKCIKCGTVLSSTVVEALGHSFGEYMPVSEGSNILKAKCIRCDFENTKTLDESANYFEVQVKKMENGVVSPFYLAKVNISGFTEKITNKEGIAEINVQTEKLSTITISADGYRTVSLSEYIYNKGKITVILKKDDGNPYASYIRFSDDNGTYDIMNCEKIIYKRDDSIEKCKISVGTKGKVELIQNNKVIATASGTGTVVFEDLFKKTLEVGYPLYVKITDDNGNFSNEKTGLIINTETFVPETDAIKDFSLSLGDGAGSFTIPSDVVGFGGMEINMDLPEFPLKVMVVKNKTVCVSVGMSVDTEEPSEGIIKDLSNEWNNYKSNKSSSKSFLKNYSIGGPINASMGFKGLGIGEIDSNGKCTINLEMIVSAEVSGSYAQQFIVGVVPLYIEFGFSAGVSSDIGANISASLNNMAETLSFQINKGILTFNIGASIEGGVGISGVLSVGVNGSASLQLDNNLLESYQTASATGGISIVARALMFSAEYKLAEKTWQLYDSRNTNTVTPNATRNNVLYSADQYSIIENASVDAITKSQDTIMNNCYEDSKAKIINANGTKYLFWLSNNENRTNENRSTLVYSKLVDNSWSEPIAIDDDGTADFNFDVLVDNENIYVAWTNVDEAIDNTINLTSATEKTEISLAVLNNTTDSKNIYSITNNETSDYYPAIFIENGKGIIGWLSNSENNIFGTSGVTSIKYCEIENEVLSSELTYTETSGQIISFDIGKFDDQISVVYSQDMDGDENTVNDLEVFLSNYKENPFVITANDCVDSNPIFQNINGENYILWYQNGRVAYMSNYNQELGLSEFYLSTDKFSLVSNENSTKLIFRAANEEGITEIYTSDYSEGKFLQPYKINSISDKMTDMSAIIDGNNNLNIVYGNVNNEIILKGENVNKSIKILDVIYDEDDLNTNEEITMEINIKNTGNTLLESIPLNIIDLDSSTKELLIENANLNINESKVYVIKYQLPEINECKTIKFNSPDLTLTDFELNIGYTDLELECDILNHKNDKILNIDISNISNIKSNATLEILIDDEIVKSENLTDITKNSDVNYTYKIEKNSYSKIEVRAEAENDEILTYNNSKIFNYDTIMIINTIVGDINKDGIITVLDLVAMKKILIGYNDFLNVGNEDMDLNQDGKVNSVDLVIMIQTLLKN
jgi:hypothetical protein